MATPGTEAAVFRDLDEGHAPRPEHSEIIHSTGVAGLLMRFSRPAMVADVLHALVHAARPGFSGTSPVHRTIFAKKMDCCRIVLCSESHCDVNRHMLQTNVVHVGVQMWV